MPASFDDVAIDYARQLRAAAEQDSILIVKAANSGGRIHKSTPDNFILALVKVAQDIDALTYHQTNQPLTATEKRRMANEVARRAGCTAPEEYGEIIVKGGSVDMLIQNYSMVERLFQMVTPKPPPPPTNSGTTPRK